MSENLTRPVLYKSFPLPLPSLSPRVVCILAGPSRVQLVEPPFARTTLQDKRKSPKLGLPGGRTHTSPPLCPDTAKPPKIFLQAEGGYPRCCSQMQPRSTLHMIAETSRQFNAFRPGICR